MSPETNELPTIPVPKFSVNAIEKLRDKLILVLADFVGTELVDVQYEEFIDRIRLAIKCVDYTTLYNSCLTLAAVTLTSMEANRTAWRLAGNLPTLKEKRPVPPWTRQITAEWVPLQIVEVLPGSNFRDERGFYVHQRILAGSPCPMKIVQFWSRPCAKWMARNLGFTWTDGKHPYARGIELTNMRFLGLIEPHLTRDGKPGYGQKFFPAGMLSWNRTILKARSHIEPPCPENFTHRCHQCHVGYDRCMAGCHPNTWVWRACKICLQENWCDPLHPRGVCIECEEKGN